MDISKGEMLVYKTDEGQIRIDAHLYNDTVWLTINQMSILFEVDKSGISRH